MISPLLIWNIRGIGNSASVRSLGQLVRSNGIQMVAISEPNIKFSSAQGIARKIGLHTVIGNEANEGDISKIWLFYVPGLNIQVVQMHHQFLTVGLIENNEISMLFSFVYASCNYVTRRVLFDELISFGEGVSVPWLVGGDFNCVTSPDEKVGGRPPFMPSLTDFHSFQSASGLIDAGFSGSPFTWSNNQLGSFHIKARLDRVFYNSFWLDKGWNMSIKHLVRGVSDHAPLLVSMANITPKPGRFIYQAMWHTHDDFLSFVKARWDEVNCVTVNPLFLLQHKLKSLKVHLRQWNKTVFGNIHKAKDKAVTDLEKAQANFDNIPSEEHKMRLNLAHALLKQALVREEIFWLQKSRIQWLNYGDRNTQFFHHFAKVRQQKNFIQRLKLNEAWEEDQEILAQGAVDHFHKLLSSEIHNIDPDMLTVIPHLISGGLNESLCMIPSAAEIKRTVFSLSSNSSPGPDGYTGSFYTFCWEIVEHDVICAVQGFFQGWGIPQGMSSTIICMIPKVKSPSCYSEFRPISLCNFSFKVITKIMNDRLQHVLPTIISTQQSGFIKGRLISDNFLLARELFMELDRPVRGHNVLFKLDMAKAYDRIEWDFLLMVMKRFGFSSRFTSLVGQTLMNCWFSISFNGQLKGYFKSTRGVRQGDPLAPTLFIIAEEVMSRGLSKLFQSGDCSYFHVPRGVPLHSHILYADDSIIFSNGCKKSIQHLLNFLEKYERSSGQSINCSKSCFIASQRMPVAAINRIKSQTGYLHKKSVITYLGIPLFKGRQKIVHFKYLVDRIQSKLAGWQSKFISQAGRVTLIKAVLSSLSIYTASAISVPKSICRQIDSICSNFFWQGLDHIHRKHWISWRRICCPVDQGGLGIRSMEDIQVCFQVKLIWLAAVSNSLWAQFVRNKYLKGSHVSDCVYPFPAGIRKSDFDRAKGLLLEGFRMSVRNGNNTNFLKDHWFRIPLTVSDSYSSDLSHCTVREVLTDHSHPVWSILSDEAVIQELKSFTLLEGDDIPVWAFTDSGDLSVKSVYRQWKKHVILLSPVDGSIKLLSNKLPPRAGLYCWKLIHKAVPIDSRLQSMGIEIVSRCSCCLGNNAVEDFDHLFLFSELAVALWNSINPLLADYRYRSGSFLGWFTWLMREVKINSAVGFITLVTLVTTTWEIWKVRCHCRYEGGKPYIIRSVADILHTVRNSVQNIKFNTPVNSAYINALHAFNIKARFKQVAFKLVRWIPPLVDHCINSDGCFKPNSGLSGGGGCIRNVHGDIILSFSFWYGLGDIIQAEGRAILDALRLALSLSIPISVIYSDSLLLVNTIVNKKSPPWVLFPWWDEILFLLSSMRCSIIHVYREANQVADSLADFATTQAENRVFFTHHELPSRAKAYALADAAALPNFRRSLV